MVQCPCKEQGPQKEADECRNIIRKDIMEGKCTVQDYINFLKSLALGKARNICDGEEGQINVATVAC